jgi:peptide/nickel transport system permease protein
MLKKIMTALLTLLVSLVLVFFIVQAMPGNPVDALTRQYMTGNQLPYDIAYERAKAALNYNPDIPVMQRFFAYVGGMLSGNLGQSMSYKESVSTIVLGALPWTLLVCSISLLLSFVVGNFLGLFVAWKRSKVMDSVLTGYQAIFGSIPDYIVAYLIIAVFSVALGWFPSRGAYSSDVVPGWNFPFILDVLYHASLPILSYFVTTVAAWVIGMKAICMGILGEDYINYAHARGLSKNRILTTYLGRNALLPQITGLAITFGFMFGGAPLIENLFVYPGVGFYLNSAIGRRDYPLMQGMFLMIIVMVLVSGIVADLLNVKLNPRLKEG